MAKERKKDIGRGSLVGLFLRSVVLEQTRPPLGLLACSPECSNSEDLTVEEGDTLMVSCNWHLWEASSARPWWEH